MADTPAENCSNVDTLPGLAHAKIAWQRYCGDDEGAQVTQHNYDMYGFGSSPNPSARVAGVDDDDESQAKEKGGEILQGVLQALQALPESVPVLGHLLGGIHYCRGDRKKGFAVTYRATRSCAVLCAGASVGAGVTTMGLSAAASGSMSVLHAASAAGAGVAAGAAVDAIVPRPAAGSVPRPLTPGDKFDWCMVRILDGLKGMAGFDIALVLSPEYVSSVEVRLEPLSAGDALHAATGHHVSGLEDIPSGTVHSYALLATNKGRLIVTERLHDGRILWENITAQSTTSFAHGHVLASQSLNPGLHHVKSELFWSQQGPFNGSSVAALSKFAEAQSNTAYDLVRSNCQHYTDSIVKFVTGEPLQALPNAGLLDIAKIVLPPTPTVPALASTYLESLAWSLQQVSALRLAADCAGVAVGGVVVARSTDSRGGQRRRGATAAEEVSPAAAARLPQRH